MTQTVAKELYIIYISNIYVRGNWFLCSSIPGMIYIYAALHTPPTHSFQFTQLHHSILEICTYSMLLTTMHAMS